MKTQQKRGPSLCLQGCENCLPQQKEEAEGTQSHLVSTFVHKLPPLYARAAVLVHVQALLALAYTDVWYKPCVYVRTCTDALFVIVQSSKWTATVRASV